MIHNEELELRMFTNEVNHLGKVCQCASCKKKQIKNDYIISPEFEMVEKQIMSRRCFYQLLVVWVSALHQNDKFAIKEVLDLVQCNAKNSKNWLSHFLYTCFIAPGYRESHTLFFYVMHNNESFDRLKRKAIFLSIMARISANFTVKTKLLCLTDVWTLLDYPMMYSDVEEALRLYAQDDFEDYTVSSEYFGDWMRASGVFSYSAIKNLCDIIDNKLKCEKRNKQLRRYLQKAKWKLKQLSPRLGEDKGKEKTAVSVGRQSLTDEKIDDIVNAIGSLDNKSTAKNHKKKKKKKKKNKKNKARIKEEVLSASGQDTDKNSTLALLKRESLLVLKSVVNDAGDSGEWLSVSSGKSNLMKEKKDYSKAYSTAWVGVAEVKTRDSNNSASRHFSNDKGHVVSGLDEISQPGKNIGLTLGQLPMSPVSTSGCQSVVVYKKDNKGGNMKKSKANRNTESVKTSDRSSGYVLKPAAHAIDGLKKVVKFKQGVTHEVKMEVPPKLKLVPVTVSFSFFTRDSSTPTGFVSLREHASNATESHEDDKLVGSSDRYDYGPDLSSLLAGIDLTTRF